MLREFRVIRVFGGSEAWEDDRNSSTYSLGTVKDCLRRHEYPLNWFSRSTFLSRFPGYYCGAKQGNLGSGALGIVSEMSW